MIRKETYFSLRHETSDAKNVINLIKNYDDRSTQIDQNTIEKITNTNKQSHLLTYSFHNTQVQNDWVYVQMFKFQEEFLKFAFFQKLVLKLKNMIYYFTCVAYFLRYRTCCFRKLTNVSKKKRFNVIKI